MAFPKSTQELLDKYWAAETSPEEETQLRKLLQDDQSATGMYFSLLQQQATLGMPASRKVKASVHAISIKRILSIAAAVLILVTAGFLIQRTMVDNVDRTMVDSYEDPMEAYEETRQALLFISSKLNTSREKAGEELAKTQPYIEIIK